MKLRLFVAINLPEEFKIRISGKIKALKPLFTFPVRFLESENWHSTLSFLGYQEQSTLNSILQAINKTSASYPAPKIEISDIDYGPILADGGSKQVRMIWLNCSKATSPALSLIKNNLEDNLSDFGVSFRRENKEFHSHLTLARFSPSSKIYLPQITEDFAYEFYPRSLDLMESHLKRSGAEYSLLSSFAFRL